MSSRQFSSSYTDFYKRVYSIILAVEITRGCVSQTDEGCQDTTYDGISVEACTCNSDYCNLATHICFKLPVLVIAAILSCVLRYLF